MIAYNLFVWERRAAAPTRDRDRAHFAEVKNMCSLLRLQFYTGSITPGKAEARAGKLNDDQLAARAAWVRAEQPAVAAGRQMAPRLMNAPLPLPPPKLKTGTVVEAVPIPLGRSSGSVC